MKQKKFVFISPAPHFIIIDTITDMQLEECIRLYHVYELNEPKTMCEKWIHFM